MATKKATGKQQQNQVDEKPVNNQQTEPATTKQPEKANGNGEKANGNGSSEFNISQEFDQLRQMLSSDLSTIEPEQALSVIDQWLGVISTAKDPELKALSSNLKELQKMIKGGKAGAHEISEVLIHLGEQTTELATNAEKAVKQPVQRLGKQLRQAGTAIAKAEDQEYHQQFDQLMEKAEGAELAALDTDEAIGMIDLWYNLLHKTEGEQFQQAAESLKHLKQVIKRDNSKPETVAKALTQVGEQTSQLAAEAPRGFKGAIQKLVKALVQASESITEAE